MSQSCRKFGYVLFGSIVLTVAAVAQGRSDQNVPTGDVWIAEGETTQWYGAVDNSAAAKSAMPTGDVWVTPDAVTRMAQPSAPPQLVRPPRERPMPRSEDPPFLPVAPCWWTRTQSGVDHHDLALEGG